MSDFPIGLCAHPKDVTLAAQAGYDYLELDLNEVMQMDEDDYRTMAGEMERSGIYAEVVCGLLAPEISIVGESVLARQIHAHLERSFELARALGAELMILDCPQARILPNNFDPAMAWRQLGNFIRILQSHAADSNLRVAILPLRRSTADLINSVSEAALISAMLRLDRIGVAASSYNMAMEAEPLPRLEHTGSLLWHVRVSNALGMRPPRRGDGEDYSSLFQTLQSMNYGGRISCEAPCTNLENACEALHCLCSAAQSTQRD